MSLLQTAACLVATTILSLSGEASAQDRPVDMNFDNQLDSVVEDLRQRMDADTELKGRKLRLGKFSARNLPDSSFEVQFESAFRELAKNLLDDTSELIISGEFDFVPGHSSENEHLHVIEIVFKVVNRQRRVLQVVTREINNTSDIVRILGINITLPDVKDVEYRNKAAQDAFESPSFDLRDGSRIQARRNADYAVEILRSKGGIGDLEPVVPRSIRGMAFVDFSHGDSFVIATYNYHKTRETSVSVTIDGLDVLHQFNADKIKCEGYLVPKFRENTPGRHVIHGWLKTGETAEGNVFPFAVGELGKGAATARKSRNSISVINAQFFETYNPGELLPVRDPDETDTGRQFDVGSQVQQIERRESPVVNIAIRYRNVP